VHYAELGREKFVAFMHACNVMVASFPGLPCFCYLVCIYNNARKQKRLVWWWE